MVADERSVLMFPIQLVQCFERFGIAIIPVNWKNKKPEFELLPKDAVGEPTWEVFKTILPGPDNVKKWCESGIKSYGVVTGWNNLVVIDFDDSGEYAKWLFWAQDHPIARFVAERAYQVRTARGVHVYVRLPQLERTRKIGKIDIKCAGGYVLGPGSMHPTGIIYTPLKSTWFFPTIATLSEILPINLLTQDTSVPTPIQPTNQTDIWESIENPFTYTDDLVAKIRKKWRIETFFPSTQKTGPHHLLTTCPLHDDQHPSFWIDTDKQICGCFSGCTPIPLDVINLVARLHGISNREAIIYLGKNTE